ncbi:MAG: HesA/MoeB/ThiF family protein [Bacteroidales bacterium]|nr:HesA/MoeB/ThiF family protein [Bacteroidales bacterium]
MVLNSEQRRRYARNIHVEQLGLEGQARLLESSALVVGCGALGSLVAVQLAAAGVGRIGIADFDTVDLSNLQRQLFFTEEDTGESKSTLIRRAIEQRNSGVVVEEYQLLITEKVACNLFPSYDVVIDGSDNPATKAMTSRVCDDLSIPCVIGGVEALSGMILAQIPKNVSGAWEGRRSTAPINPATWASLFPSDSDNPSFSPCSIAGVLGPIPGVIASLQSLEAIKILAGVGRPLASRLLIFDGLATTFREIHL